MLAAGLTPLVPYPGGSMPWLCRHKCGNEVRPHYKDIKQGDGGCGFCSGRIPDMEKVLAAMSAAGLTPLDPYPGCMKRWRCRHKCGREVSPYYNTIQQGDGGCGFCAGKKVDPDEAVSKMVAAGLTPLVPYPGANKPWSSLHECGREVAPHYSSIRNGGRGCRHCVGQVADLAKIKAEMQAAGLTPLVPYPGSLRPWLCRHECGKEVSPWYTTIQQRHGGCSYCANIKVDLDDVMATMANAGMEPLEPYPGSGETWLCRHACGREVNTTYATARLGRNGCGYCSGRIPDMEKVLAVMSSSGLTPLDPYPGHDAPWRCLHTCGNEVRPHYSSIKQGGGGCRFCAPYGYNPSKPGHVYLIELDSHPGFPRGVIKIGIAGGKSGRMKSWEKRGWRILESFRFEDGTVPVEIESHALKWLNEDLGLEPCLSLADVGYMGGFTETVSVADLTESGVSVADVRKKVRQLVEKASTPSLD